MCDFCNKKKPKDWDNWVDKREFNNDSIANEFDATIKGNKLIVIYDAYSCDSSFYEEIDIKYCPMCGILLYFSNVECTKLIKQNNMNVVILITDDNKGLYTIYEESGEIIEDDFASYDEANEFVTLNGWNVVKTFNKNF
jgi:hypothetical protein